jgi:hypothetical protein
MKYIITHTTYLQHYLRRSVTNHGNILSKGNHDAYNWCKYLRTTPEPPILLYGRIPKCGSTTILELFDRIVLKNKFFHWSKRINYYRNFEKDNASRAELVHDLVRAYRHGHQHLVADGHWQHTYWHPHEFAGLKFENIQLTRQCESRIKSLLLMTLWDLPTEVLIGGTRLSNFRYYFNTNRSIVGCLNNYDCLKYQDTQGFFHPNRNALNFFCNTEICRRIFRNSSIGAKSNIHNLHIYTVIGALEYLEEFLEMLECAYPNKLAGIADLYKKENIHVNKGKHHAIINSTALDRRLHEACDAKINEYKDFYDDLVETARMRYYYMKKYPGDCCRKRSSHLR